MRPEVNHSLSNFATTVPPLATFPDIYLDGIPDGAVLGGTIFTAGPGGYYVTVSNIPLGITLITPLLAYGVTHSDVVLSPIVGTATGYIDSIRINVTVPAFSITTFTVTKGPGGPLRKVCTRMLVNFNGSHDSFVSNHANCFYFNLPGMYNWPGCTQTFYARIKRDPGAPALQYYLYIYSDAARTIRVYESTGTMYYGSYYYDIDMMLTAPPNTVVGTAGCYVPVNPGADVDFTLVKATWDPDDQGNPTNFIDISDYLVGQIKIDSQENEAIINKQIARKLNVTLRNEGKVFDYRVFAAYNPYGSPPCYNGPYDPYIFHLTGRKIGNLRAGRFVVYQVGVWDAASSSWTYIDKFRGRLGDFQLSRQDRTLQLSIDDESAYFKKFKTEKDIYVNKTFEYIFNDQAVRRLGFTNTPINTVIVPTTNQKIPFVYMPDLGDTVFDALVKLSESIGGKVDLMEDGTIRCFSRMIDGDQIYVFGAGGGTDEARTLGDNVVQNGVDILSSSILYNQNIVNRVSVQSKPTIIEQKSEKVWKFKAFYDEKLGKNTGMLKPGRFFGDVWAQNTSSYTQTGPVQAIDRSTAFSSTITDEIVNLEITAKGVSPNVTVSLTYNGATVSNVETADGVTEFNLGTYFAALNGVYVTLATYANISILGSPIACTQNDAAELQLGVRYYADFGTNFRVLPNRGTGHATDYMTFAIRSAITLTGVELVSDSIRNSWPDRVVMALPNTLAPAPIDARYDNLNVFYAGSTTGDALSKVPILLYNADPVNTRYVTSLEIFGYRIKETTNFQIDVRALQYVIDSFGGEQLMTIQNDTIPNSAAASKLGKFICDNYAGCRDLPKLSMKQPRPFLQVGDRVQNVDDYTGVTREYIVNKTEETYTTDNASLDPITLREADAGLGPYDPTNSQASVEITNTNDYSKLDQTVDTNVGAAASEVRKDIYNMRGISYHGRRFDFTTGLYSNAPAPGAPVPALPWVPMTAAPFTIAEAFWGEMREFETAPTVIVIPLALASRAGAGVEATTGLFNIAKAVAGSETKQVDMFSWVAGEGGNQFGWYYWEAIGTTKSTT